jgi:hypothetical protein
MERQNMITSLSTNAQEQSTYVITVAFKDEDGQDVIPTAATWTLTDSGGAVINSRLDVAISPPAASVDIVLTGDDLLISTGFTGDSEERIFTIQATYDSSLGTGLVLKGACKFRVENLSAIA